MTQNFPSRPMLKLFRLVQMKLRLLDAVLVMRHYVYVIECVNGHYYTGYTTDVVRRYREHQAGSIKCKYTRAFPPKKLAAVWDFENKSDALRFEYHVKSLARKEKETLILARASVGEFDFCSNTQ